MIRIIAAREVRALFASSLAWIVLAIFQAILAWIFLARLDAFLGVQAKLQHLVNPPGVTEWIAAPLFSAASMIFLMIVPLFTMRLIAEEARNQTLPLLFSAPISSAEIVIGKYLGLLAFLGAAILLVLLMALSLLIGGKIDFGLIASKVFGLFLAASSFAALGLYLSCLTSHPFLAGIGGIGALLGLWAVRFGSGGFFQAVSPSDHFERFNQGLVDSGDIAYFLLAILLFLTLSIWHLEKR
jgi:ABC-2 type transport system permease protein